MARRSVYRYKLTRKFDRDIDFTKEVADIMYSNGNYLTPPEITDLLIQVLKAKKVDRSRPQVLMLVGTILKNLQDKGFVTKKKIDR